VSCKLSGKKFMAGTASAHFKFPKVWKMIYERRYSEIIFNNGDLANLRGL